MHPAGAEWTGFYYDGRTARREPVTITIAPGALSLQTPGGGAMLWPFEQLRQTQGAHAGEQLRLEFGTNPVESVLVEQPGLAEAIRRASPGVNPTLRGRQKTMRIVSLSLGTVVLGIAAYLWGAPVMAAWLAPMVPAEWESRMGRSSIDRFLVGQKVCDDSLAVADLRAVMDRLLAGAPASTPTFQLYVVRDSSVNAFAAPGGYIVVNSGLLAAAKSPEEVAGVLAHEIQHVLHRHSTRAVIRDVPLRFALATLSGGSGMETAAGVAASLGSLKYRRSDESESDRDGMAMLRAARVDAGGMAAFMRTLESRREFVPRFVSYLSSHPRTAERAAQLEGLARQSNYEVTPLLDSAAWSRVQRMCKTTAFGG